MLPEAGGRLLVTALKEPGVQLLSIGAPAFEKHPREAWHSTLAGCRFRLKATG